VFWVVYAALAVAGFGGWWLGIDRGSDAAFLAGSAAFALLGVGSLLNLGGVPERYARFVVKVRPGGLLGGDVSSSRISLGLLFLAAAALGVVLMFGLL